MANVSDKSILTAAGKALLAQLNAEEKALVIDKMIFANVPNRPEYPQPDDVVPTDNVVYQAAVEQRGRLSEDSVIYSTTLASNEGPFEFNWTGAYCSEYGVLVTIDHHSLTPKTVDEPGVSGNTLVRSVVLEYKDIAEITNITVDASTWQYNATPRMKKMDDDVAQANIDQNGKDWFIEEGFLVTPQASAFSIKAGAGYVSGNRVALDFDRSIQVPNKPSFIYIDAHREGTPTGEQVTLFNFVVSAEEKDDYIDSSTGKDVPHFVCKIAQVLGDGSVNDLRPQQSGNFDFPNIDALKNRSLNPGKHAFLRKGMKVTTGATTWSINEERGLDIGDGLFAEAYSDIHLMDYADSTTGELSDEQLEQAINDNLGKTLVLSPKPYKFTKVPINIDKVTIMGSAKQRLLWEGEKLPLSLPILTGDKEVALVSCVVRYYEENEVSEGSQPGWYTLQDAGENHDTLIMGPVTGSGIGQLNINVGFSELGLDPNEWTPSGFVVGPDETLARDGVTFGASVSSNNVSIYGSYNVPSSTYVKFNDITGMFESPGSDSYVFEWFSGQTGELRMTRNPSPEKGAYNRVSLDISMRREVNDGGPNYVEVAISKHTSEYVSVTFWDKDGNNISTPNKFMKFYLTDGAIKNPSFNFGESPGGTANIWMVGVFVKRKGFN